MSWYDRWINNDPNDDSYNVVGASTVADMIEAALKEERARIADLIDQANNRLYEADIHRVLERLSDEIKGD